MPNFKMCKAYLTDCLFSEQCLRSPHSGTKPSGPQQGWFLPSPPPKGFTIENDKGKVIWCEFLMKEEGK